MPGTDIHTSSPEAKVSSLQKPYIMQQEDDLRGLEKVMQLMRGISVLFLLLHFYWFCYGWFDMHGCTLGVLDRLLRNVQRTTGLFTYLYLTKLFAAGFLALSCWGTRSVRSERITHRQILLAAAAGLLLFFFGDPLRHLPPQWAAPLYVAATSIGFLLLFLAGLWLGRLVKERLREDPFNDENESFMQETRLIENEYSVNLPTLFRYQGRTWQGWLNIPAVFRAVAVIGSPGSGKSFTVINNFIRQFIEKSFCLYIYDFKYPDLSTLAYNHLLRYKDRYEVTPQFCVINFDDPRHSHRCNPLKAEFLTDIADSYEAANVTMLGLNRSWSQKQGDFFIESSVILFAAIIWFLKIYENGKYCTFPHAVELLMQKYEEVFTILMARPELEGYVSAFVDAWKSGAVEQLAGQVASTKIALSRIISPSLYWVMSGDDFSLDINNPKAPKILCVGNNPERVAIYGAALSLYNSRIVKMINRKGQQKCGVIVDELPTIFFKGLDQLVATARSNRVAVCLGMQDFSQLTRDYGEQESKVIQNIVGNIISGQVVGDTARILSERFGKIVQQRQSLNINREDKSTGINTQLDNVIPASKISNLSQGEFVGAVADNFGDNMSQKMFHARIIVDTEKIKAEEKQYRPIPVLSDFTDENGKDRMAEVVEANYYRIKQEAAQIVEDELRRIAADPKLQHLFKGNAQ